MIDLCIKISTFYQIKHVLYLSHFESKLAYLGISKQKTNMYGMCHSVSHVTLGTALPHSSVKELDLQPARVVELCEIVRCI